ncbi:helix-turn-helix domain-containing protein [Saccharothrix australiensis]|nr:helix-turn-helix transcriptional regulator [Saccharothrix australiensis]
MTEDEPGPVVARLLLGDRLREFREGTGMSLEQVETQLKERLPKWYRTKLNKVENGGLKTTEAEVAELLSLYGVTGQQAAEVEQLAREARRKVAPSRVPDWFKQFVSLSHSANEIRMWSGDLIPGQVQTAAYARECLAESVVISAAEVGPIAEDRERRGNALFQPSAPAVWVVVGEEALIRRVGTPAVMRGQLERLRALSELPHVSFRVVPLDAGPHPAIGYPFTLLYLERAKSTIAYIEWLTGADYVKKSDTYTLAFSRIESKALSEDASRAMLDRLIADLH